MTDASTPKQAAEPNQDITSSEQSQTYAPPNPGGSAQLDANIAAGASTHPKQETFTDPIATNFSSGTGTGNAKTADASTVAGPYSGNQEQSEKGTVHLQNNPDLPDSDAQGTLPDTDSIGLPNNTDVNLPE